MNTLTNREVYQVLKDTALGVRFAQAEPAPSTDAGLLSVDIEGWKLTLYRERGHLLHCAACQAPDGRACTLENWHRFGTNPVDLLSQWERAQLEQMLAAMV